MSVNKTHINTLIKDSLSNDNANLSILNDSIREDNVGLLGKSYVKVDDYSKMKNDSLSTTLQQPNYIKGIDREEYIFNNNIVTTMIIICFLLFTYCYSTSSRFIEKLFTEIFISVPRQSFTFESTLTMLRLKVVMLIVTFIVEGMGLFVVYDRYIEMLFSDIGSIILIFFFASFFFVIYIIQVIILRLIGYIFSNKSKIKLLIQGLTNITIVLGLSLILPVLIAIYYSLALKTFLMIVIILYFITRVMFIYKGVKIFFNGFNSLVYLILYLCAIEITSLFFYYRILFLILNGIEHKLT